MSIVSPLPLVIAPDSRLLEMAMPVETFGRPLQALVAEMRATVVQAGGIGLAAPQVGSGQRLALVNRLAGRHGTEWAVLVNPRLVEHTGEQINLEGCLSIPGVRVSVKRPARVVVEALDEKGRGRRFPFFGLAAACALHEMDHLDGVLITARNDQELALPVGWAAS